MTSKYLFQVRYIQGRVTLCVKQALSYIIYYFTHLKLCLATATHNFKWVKITDICLNWDQTFAKFDLETLI